MPLFMKFLKELIEDEVATVYNIDRFSKCFHWHTQQTFSIKWWLTIPPHLKRCATLAYLVNY